MKKFVALLLALILGLSSQLALALSSDFPFKEGVNYYEPFRTFNAQPTMLNFGCARLAPGEDLYAAPKTTIRKQPVAKVEGWMDEGRLFYTYAKWMYRKPSDGLFIEAMMVMTDPTGKYFATYGEWDQEPSRAGAVYSWFFDATDCLRRCREANEGALPKGEYAFSLFFNNKMFRVSRVQLY